MAKKYTVTYKTGQRETVTGSIVFFSSINTDVRSEVARVMNPVYLNADDVRSVVENQTEGGTTDGSTK